MAATWTVKLDVTNVTDKVMTVTATRVDGEDVRTYSLAGISYRPTDARKVDTIGRELAATFRKMYTAEASLAAETKAASAQELAIAAALNAEER